MAFLLLNPVAAIADCTSPAMPNGSIFYNAAQNVPQACVRDEWIALGELNPSAGGGSCSSPAMNEGSMFYNEDFGVLQYCNGTDWRALGEAKFAGCSAPSDCSSIGDVCTDGILFAGYIVENSGICRIIYVTDNNQSGGVAWKTSTGTNDISTDDHYDGNNNHIDRAGTLTDFPAFDLCESNTYHGHNDWYLPSINEAQLLGNNYAAIDANAASSFLSGSYWTSTEVDTNQAWRKAISGNSFATNSAKTTATYRIRCIRTAIASGGSCSDPCAGSPSIGDFCADGTVYAGLSPDGNVPMYTTPGDQSNGTPWNNNNGNDTASGQTSAVTGAANSLALTETSGGGACQQDDPCDAETTAGVQPHQAAQICADFGSHGHDDWYLPAKNELNILYTNKDAIGAFTSGQYWSSTEISTGVAENQNFSNSTFPTASKGGWSRIRTR